MNAFDEEPIANKVRSSTKVLEDELKLEVQPALIEDLDEEIRRWAADDTDNVGREIHIITTGFHINEVRKVVKEMPIQVDVLITNLNPETRRQLEAVGENGKFGFICRDKESAMLYKYLLKAELGYEKTRLTTCTLAETEKVQAILDTSDMVLVSPPVYEAVKQLCPPGKVVYQVFQRVDPMSLKVVKDKILGASAI